MKAGASARVLTCWATAGFVLLQVGWVLLMAPFAAIDEFDHAFRASSVAAGHIVEKPVALPTDFSHGDLIPVRADIAAAANPACANLPYTKRYNCLPYKHLSGDEVLIASSATRYNPTFYAIVGFAAKPFHGIAGLYAMRAAAGLICAALFALSVGLTAGWARTRWPVIATLLVALPTTIYSASIATPNGIQILSGLAVWSALLHRLYSERSGRLAYAGLGISIILLANTHTLGSFWLVCIICASTVLVGVRQFLERMRPHGRTEWLILCGAAVSVLFAGSWVVLQRTNDPRGPVVLGSSVWPNIPRELILWPLQAIAAFPFRDERAAPVVYTIGVLVLVSIALTAMWTARHDARLRWAIAAVVVASYGIPVALTVATFSRGGLNWQGRYGMTFTAGLLLLFGVALERGGARPVRALTIVLLMAWMVMQVVGQHDVLGRQAADPLLAESGWWAPPVALIVALGVGATAAWIRVVSMAIPTIPTSPQAEGMTTEPQAHTNSTVNRAMSILGAFR